MDIDLIFKIAAIGIIVAVLNQLLVRSGREEQALMTTLTGLVVKKFEVGEMDAMQNALLIDRFELGYEAMRVAAK